MFKKLVVNFAIGSALVLMVVSIVACSAVPAPVQQAFASATPTATDTPTPAPPTPQTKNNSKTAPANAALPNGIKTLGLEAGVVTSNTGSMLSLRLGKNTDQLQISPSTIVVVPGTNNARASDIHVGDRVIADVLEQNANSTAELVLAFPNGYTADNVLTGAVQTNVNGALALKTKTGARQITTSSSTLVVNMIQDQPTVGTLAEIKRGNAVLVIGQANADTMTAQVIVLLDKDALQNGRKNAPSATPTP